MPRPFSQAPPIPIPPLLSKAQPLSLKSHPCAWNHLVLYFCLCLHQGSHQGPHPELFHAPGSLCSSLHVPCVTSVPLCPHAPLRVLLCPHLSAGDVHEDGKAGQMVALAADMTLVAEGDFTASC